MGVDIALYSCSKFIGGHSDLLLGALCVNDKELYDKLLFIAKSMVPSQLSSYLLADVYSNRTGSQPI